MSISTWWMTSVNTNRWVSEFRLIEGVEGQKTYIVKEGIHDQLSARPHRCKHYGVAPANGRRDTFRNTPIPRMRATYMEAGNMKEADIISTVKKGIYCDGWPGANRCRRLYLLCEVGLLD